MRAGTPGVDSASKEARLQRAVLGIILGKEAKILARDTVASNILVLHVRYPHREYVVGAVFGAWPDAFTKVFVRRKVAEFVRAQNSPLHGKAQWVEILILGSRLLRQFEDMRSGARMIERLGSHVVDVVAVREAMGHRGAQTVLSKVYASDTQPTGTDFLTTTGTGTHPHFLDERSFMEIRSITDFSSGEPVSSPEKLKSEVAQLRSEVNELVIRLGQLAARIALMDEVATKVKELDARIVATPFRLEFSHQGRPYRKNLVSGDLYELRILSEVEPIGTYDQPAFFTPEQLEFRRQGHEWVGEVTPKREFKLGQIRRHNKLRLTFRTDPTPWEIPLVVRRENLDFVLVGVTLLSAIISIVGFVLQWPLLIQMVLGALTLSGTAVSGGRWSH